MPLAGVQPDAAHRALGRQQKGVRVAAGEVTKLALGPQPSDFLQPLQEYVPVFRVCAGLAGFALIALAGGTCASLLSSCGEERANLAWNVSFACESDRARTERLQLRVRKGGCASSTVVYDVTLARSEQPAQASSLPPGEYGLEAVAMRASEVVAMACLDTQLPAKYELSLALRSTTCAASSADGGAGLDGGAVSPLDATADAWSDPPGDGAAASGDEGGPSDADVPCVDDRCSVPDACVGCDDAQVSCTSNEDCGGSACVDGGCVENACGEGDTRCEGACVNLASSSAHCGVCGRACASGQSCENGACKPDVAAGCSAYRYGTHDYLICSDRQAWAAAQALCRGWGFGLVILDDADESQFLRLRSGAIDHWAGGNDRGDDGENCRASAAEGSWYWALPLSTGAGPEDDKGRALCAFADAQAAACTANGDPYLGWAPGEPNNRGCSCLEGVCSEGEDCLLLVAATGEWNDSPCAEAAPYICETP